MATLTFTLTMTAVDCPRVGCGVVFGIDQRFERRRREDHATFYCPNGHSMSYSDRTEAEEQKVRADRAESQLRSARASAQAARDQADAATRSAAAYKGRVTRIRNMVANGICPVPGCRRNFENVREHMATVHPDYHRHEVTE